MGFSCTYIAPCLTIVISLSKNTWRDGNFAGVKYKQSSFTFCHSRFESLQNLEIVRDGEK